MHASRAFLAGLAIASCRAARGAALGIVLGVVLSGIAHPAAAGDPERGRLLYANHCTQCHTDDVHFREQSKVRRRTDILDWVGRWQGYLALRWSRDEVEDVAAYLDERYYRLPSGAPK